MVKSPSPDVVSGWSRPFRGDPAGVFGPGARDIGFRRAGRRPPRFLAPERGRDPNPTSPLTPHVVCSWSCRLDRPALPVTGVAESRSGKPKQTETKTRAPMIPLRAHRGSEPKPRTQRACFREARRRRRLAFARAFGRGSLPAPFREEERHPLHPRCLPSWDPRPARRWLHAVLPAQALARPGGWAVVHRLCPACGYSADAFSASSHFPPS